MHAPTIMVLEVLHFSGSYHFLMAAVRVLVNVTSDVPQGAVLDPILFPVCQ